jgi:hypothetical protein
VGKQMCKIIIPFSLLEKLDDRICYEIKNKAFEKYREIINGTNVISFKMFSLEDEFIKISITSSNIVFEIASWNESYLIVEDVEQKIIEDENGCLINFQSGQYVLIEECARPFHKYIKDFNYTIKLKEFNQNNRINDYFNFFESQRNSIICDFF